MFIENVADNVKILLFVS